MFVENTNVEEVTSKDKSVAGRAVVGSLLGPVGAVVGGMSGVGSKSKKKDLSILIIGYEKDGDIKQMSFMGGLGTFGFTQLSNKLKLFVKDKNISKEL